LKRTLAITVFILIVLTSLPFVHADRGIIPVTPGVSVYEPGQKAIIAWNGQEEILILSTDVSASQQALVLEILPLPSRPEVEAASFQSFQEIQEMIWEEGLNLLMYSSKVDARGNSVQVLFHEEIGAHNITVVQATESSGLIDWMNVFLASSGVNQTMTLRNFQSAVEDYMSRGFKHFALDLITFSPQERSIDPILYRFNSSTLYYPLLITSPLGGNGKITLFTLTKKRQEYLSPLSRAFYQTSDRPWQPIQFTLSTGELARIDLRISELLPEGGWLGVFQYDGDLSSLNTDIMATEVSPDQSTNPTPTVLINIPTEAIALFFLLGAASALAGATIAFLISRIPRKK
jgi:hypothetical protein